MKTINYVIEITPADLIRLTTGEKLYEEIDEETNFVIMMEE